MALSSSQKIISIIKTNNFWLFLSSELPSLFREKIESHKKVFKDKDFCNVIMSSELNQYQKSDKAPFIIYADLECIIEKIDGCKNNPEYSSTTKVSQYIPSDYATFTISSYRSIYTEVKTA